MQKMLMIFKTHNRTVDIIKTILIYLLAASMLVMAGTYINARQNVGQRNELPPEKRIIFGLGGSFFLETDERHLHPVQITVTRNGRSMSALHNDSLIARVYDNDTIKFAILMLFSRTTERIILDDAAGEQYWQAAAASENSIYIRYAGDYIHSLIHAFLSNNFDIADTGDGPIVTLRELFIVDKDPTFGIARDSQGNIAVFRPDSETLGGDDMSARINASLHVAYNNIVGGLPCRFLNSDIISGEIGANRNNIQNLRFCPSFHLFENPLYLPAVLAENPLLGYDGNINLQQDCIRQLFGLLGFHHERAYTISSTEFITYRDGVQSVNFSNNGQIVYRNTEGLHLARFLGADTGYFSLFDKLRAASAFANALSNGLTDLMGGTESNLYLTNIFFENRELIVKFAYYHAGTKVRINGSDSAVILRITQNGITEAVINTVRLTSMDMKRSINPILTLSEADRLVSKYIADESYEYDEYAKEDDAEFDELSSAFNLDEYTSEEIQNNLFVNRIELMYIIDLLSDINDINEFSPAWVIK